MRPRALAIVIVHPRGPLEAGHQRQQPGSGRCGATSALAILKNSRGRSRTPQAAMLSFALPRAFRAVSMVLSPDWKRWIDPVVVDRNLIQT